MNDNIVALRDRDTLFDVGSLYAELSAMQDRRHAKGKRYPLALVLLCF